MLIDTVFSLLDVADKLFDMVGAENVYIDNVAKMFTEKTEDMIKNLIKNTSNESVKSDKKLEPVEKHVLVVDKDANNDTLSPDSWTSVVKLNISEKLKKLPVNKTVLSKEGKGCIFLPDENTLNEAKKALASEYSVTETTIKPTAILPILRINNLKAENFQNADELKSSILEKNVNIRTIIEADKNSVIEVVFVDKKLNCAVIKVTPDIRESVFKTKKIFVDLESHYVSDSFHVQQCYHCQAYGHKANSDKCPNKDADPVCFYCGGSHKSADCRQKKNKNKQKCVNCNKSTTNNIKNGSNSHNANNKACPLYMKEVEFIKSKTCYDPKNYKKYHRT